MWASKNAVVGREKGESDPARKRGSRRDICFARLKIWSGAATFELRSSASYLTARAKHHHLSAVQYNKLFSVQTVRKKKNQTIAQPLSLLCFDSRKRNGWPSHEISSFHHPEELCHCWFLPNLRTSCPLPPLWPEKLRAPWQRPGNDAHWFPSPGCRSSAFTSQQSHWRTPQGSGHQTPAGQVPTAPGYRAAWGHSSHHIFVLGKCSSPVVGILIAPAAWVCLPRDVTAWNTHAWLKGLIWQLFQGMFFLSKEAAVAQEQVFKQVESRDNPWSTAKTSPHKIPS